VDIFDHVTSMARVSRSRVSKNDVEPAGPLHSSLVCHDGYPHAAGTACISTAPSATLLRNQVCLKTRLWTECRPTLKTSRCLNMSFHCGIP